MKIIREKRPDTVPFYFVRGIVSFRSFRTIPVRKLLMQISHRFTRRLQPESTPASMICARPSEDLSSFRGYPRCRAASYGRTAKPEQCPGWGLSRRRLLRSFERFLRSKPRSINSIRRETMLNIHRDASQPSRVTVAFEHGAAFVHDVEGRDVRRSCRSPGSSR